MIKKGLKTFKNPAILLSASLGLWLGVSCQDDMLAERQPVIAGDEISFMVASDSAIAARSLASAPPVTHRQFLTTIGKDSLFLYTTIEENTDQPFKKSAESRAAQKTDETLKTNSFYVDAMYRSEVNADAQFMNGTKVEWDGAWKYSPVKYWPNNEGDKLDFYGYMDAPDYGTFAWATDKKNEKFSYTLPAHQTDNEDATRQSDLIFAQALNQTKQSVNGRVMLNFYHALSAILFKVGSLPSDISLKNLKITLNEVKNSGTCTIKNTNNELSFDWNSTGEESYSQIFSSDNAYNNTDNADLSTIDKKTAFMMIPQTFVEGASMNIYFEIGDAKYSFNHPLVIGEGKDAHLGWNANTKYTYILTIHEYVEVDVKETFDEANNPSVKSDVRFQNTGLSDAFMRAAIVGYWVNSAGDVVANWEEGDGEGEFTNLDSSTNWFKKDGYYYHKNKVDVGAYTSVLFSSYTLKKDPPVVGASLELNIVVQAVQEGASVPWEGISVSNGTLISNE